MLSKTRLAGFFATNERGKKSMEYPNEFERLTSRTGETVRKLAKLKDAKYRKEYGFYLAEGVKLAEEALERTSIVFALLSEDAADPTGKAYRLAKEAGERGAKVYLLSKEVFEKISTESAPQGLIFVLACPTETSDKDALGNERALMLSEIRDPGNLGTIMRSASAFGVTTLVLSDCADVYNPKTVRASMGALFRLKIVQTSDLPALIETAKQSGRRVLAAALSDRSKTLGDFEVRKTDIPLIGNEGHGLSDELIAAASETVKIPMEEGTESLNAAIAASVLLWEIYR